MLSRRKAWIFGIGIIALLLIGVYLLVSFWPKVSYFSDGWNKKTEESFPDEKWAEVERIIDGDTIELENGEKVRYIGINAPESVDARRRIECFGKEASAFNKNLVEGKRVRLEKDISDRDKYGRLLRFIFLEDGTFVNEVLVREGYAYATPYVPDISKKELFRESETFSRKNHRGLWASEKCNGRK